MNEVVKDFTIIDLLAMLVPGSFFTLFLNYYFIDLNAYFKEYFNDNNFILVFCFIFISYFLGSLLHEGSKFIEKFFWGNPGTDYLKSIKELGKVKFWRKKNAENFCAEYESIRKQVRGENNELCTASAAFDKIKGSVYGVRSYRKRVLFSSFYGMSRTFSLLIPLLILLLGLTGKIEEIIVFKIDASITMSYIFNAILFLVVEILFFIRARRFKILSIRYTFTDYVLEQTHKNHSSQQHDVENVTTQSVDIIK